MPRLVRLPAIVSLLVLGLLAGCASQRSASRAPPPTRLAADGTRAPAVSSRADDQDAGRLEDSEDFWGEEEGPLVADPLEPFNRSMFWVNDKLYFYLFKPVVRVYRVVPQPARESVGNFFSNLATPVRFGNAVLQLKLADAGNEVFRFLFNSTFGIAGLFDFVKAQGGPGPKEEDFGQTLGRYGAGQGFYLVLPVLGPSSLRDGVGRVADWYLDPLAYYLKFEERVGLRVVETGNELSLDKDTYEAIVREQLDPYAFVRDGYVQRRASQVAE